MIGRSPKLFTEFCEFIGSYHSSKATISDFGTRSHTAKLIATSCVCHNRLQCLLPLLLPHLGRLHSRRPAQYVLLLALLLLVL
jgi:hypothetical protein